MPHMQLRSDISTDLLQRAYSALQQPIAGQDAERGPSSYIVVVTFLGLALTGLGTAPLIQRLARVAPKKGILDEPYRWLCTTVVFLSPLVLSLLYSISVFAPKHARMIMVMLSFWEVAAVFAVFQLLLGFLGNTRKEQRDTFESQDELRLMWVLSPIICFCCYSCMELRRPSGKDLGLIWVCVLQYMVLNPVFVSIQASEVEPHQFYRFLRIVSLIALVYSICVLIEATRKKTLKARKPHKKFWCIKFLVVFTFVVHNGFMSRSWSAGSVQLAGAWSAIIPFPFAYAMAYGNFFPRRDIVMGTLEDDSDTNDSDDVFLTKEDENKENAEEG